MSAISNLAAAPDVDVQRWDEICTDGELVDDRTWSADAIARDPETGDIAPEGSRWAVAFAAFVIMARTRALFDHGLSVSDALGRASQAFYPLSTSRTREQIAVWDLLGTAFDRLGFQPTDDMSSAARLDEVGRGHAHDVLIAMCTGLRIGYELAQAAR